jgi:transposase
MNYTAVAKGLLIDDATLRTWHRLYQEQGIEGLASFGYEGSACRLSEQQQDKLTAWITETLPRSTRAIGAWIEQECGIEYQGRSGLTALLHRLGMAHRKPKAVSRKLDPEKQAALSRPMRTCSTTWAMTRRCCSAMPCIRHRPSSVSVSLADASETPRSARSAAGGQRTPRSRWSRAAAASA